MLAWSVTVTVTGQLPYLAVTYVSFVLEMKHLDCVVIPVVLLFETCEEKSNNSYAIGFHEWVCGWILGK